MLLELHDDLWIWYTLYCVVLLHCLWLCFMCCSLSWPGQTYKRDFVRAHYLLLSNEFLRCDRFRLANWVPNVPVPGDKQCDRKGRCNTTLMADMADSYCTTGNSRVAIKSLCKMDKLHFPRLLLPRHLHVHMSQCNELVLLALMLVNKLALESFKLVLTIDNSEAGQWGPTGLFHTHRLNDGTVRCEHINRKVWLERKIITLCSLRGIIKQPFWNRKSVYAQRLCFSLLPTGFGQKRKTAAYCGLPEGSDTGQQSPLAPIGSQRLLPASSAGTKNLDFFNVNAIECLSNHLHCFIF